MPIAVVVVITIVMTLVVVVIQRRRNGFKTCLRNPFYKVNMPVLPATVVLMAMGATVVIAVHLMILY